MALLTAGPLVGTAIGGSAGGDSAATSSAGATTGSAEATTGSAEATSEITGRWLVEKRDGIVLIERQGDYLVGKLVWAKDRDGIKGDERLDAKNPQPELRSRKVLGIEILSGIPATPREDGWYGRGHVYNPKTGKSYNVKIKLEAPDRLRLRVGRSILGYTTRWTRAQ